MLSPASYELANYVVDRLMEEDPKPDSPSGEILRTLSLAIIEYEKAMKPKEEV